MNRRKTAPYVEHRWRGICAGWRRNEPRRCRNPSVHLIFEPNIGGRVTGVAGGKFSRTLEGKGSVFATKFTPGGFHAFAGTPISRFTGTIVRVPDVFGADGDALERAMLTARIDAARIRIIEKFLRTRRPKPDETAARIARIVYAIARDRQILKVDDLVNRYGTNARNLQRLFAKYVGVSPKWVIQRYRLHEAAEQTGRRNRSQPVHARARSRLQRPGAFRP